MGIPELMYVADFVASPDEATLLAAVDAAPWLSDLKLRVQHYGYRYDYKARRVDPSMYLGPLPDWAQPLAGRLVGDGYMPTAPDQLIVNEYEPGQGITAHVDCVPCFGPVVCSLTLGSPCVMDLSAVEGAAAESPCWNGEACWSSWPARHDTSGGTRIPGRKTDKVGGRALGARPTGVPDFPHSADRGVTIGGDIAPKSRRLGLDAESP